MSKATLTFIILMLAAMITCSGCSLLKDEAPLQKSLPQAPGTTDGGSDKYSASLDESASHETSGESDSMVTNASASEMNDTKRMIIYTVTMAMDIKNMEKSIKNLNIMVGESKGYIISENISKSGDSSRYATFTIKVPAAGLTPFIDKISQLGEVTSQSKTGQDVTEEYVDKSARLENMKREEKRYHELFASAKTVDDMLKIEKELGRVRGDIEALQGRLNFLEKNVAMSTVQLTLQEKFHSTPKSFWSFGETFDNAKSAQRQLIKSLASCSIYFAIVFLPLILIIAVPIAIIVRLIDKSKKKRGAAGGDNK